MVVYGFAKGYRYAGDGTLMIKVRVPNEHGAYDKAEYGGKTIRNYTEDADLPWVPSLLLPHLPQEGEVVALTTLDSTSSNWLVIGLTGGSYRYPNINR